MEGISHEAIALAGHLGLGRLIVLFDDNGISIDGPTSLSTSEDQIGRFQAAGWNTMAIDGHDPAAIRAALGEARSDNSKPWLIACKTVIGFGAPKKQGTAATHGSPLGADEIKGAREALGWPHEPFVVPAAIQKAWAEAGARGSAERKAWEQRWAKVDANLRARFAEPLSGDGRAALTAAIKAAKAAFAADASKRATRNWSELTLEKITRRDAGADRWIGRSDRLEQYQGQEPDGDQARRLRRQLYPLRRPRARHGGCHERHGAATAASCPMAAPSWCSPIIAGRRSGCRR